MIGRKMEELDKVQDTEIIVQRTSQAKNQRRITIIEYHRLARELLACIETIQEDRMMLTCFLKTYQDLFYETTNFRDEHRHRISIKVCIENAKKMLKSRTIRLMDLVEKYQKCLSLKHHLQKCRVIRNKFKESTVEDEDEKVKSAFKEIKSLRKIETQEDFNLVYLFFNCVFDSLHKAYKDSKPLWIVTLLNF